MNQLFRIGSVWITPLAFESFQKTDFQVYLDSHQTGKFGDADRETCAQNLEAIEYMNGNKKPDMLNIRKTVISVFDSNVSGYKIIIRTDNVLGQSNTFVSRSNEYQIPTLASS